MDKKKRFSIFLSSAILIWSVENILALVFAPAYENCVICGTMTFMSSVVYACLVAVVFTVLYIYLWEHLKVRNGVKIGFVFALIASMPTTISFLILTTLPAAFSLAWFLTVFFEFALAGWVAELVIKQK